VAELRTRAPFEDLALPLALGAARLAAMPMGRILSVAPYPGCEAGVADRLGGFPTPGVVHSLEAGRLVWAGRDQAFLFDAGGGEADWPERLAGLAAVTDQSDGWAGSQLSGADADEVLARLVPLDLSSLSSGRSARSLLNHMPLLLIRNEAGLELWSFRSMAGTMLHEVATAMRAVAARRAPARTQAVGGNGTDST